ncbi:hypothetical protein [Yeosuana marina]|uniref:hypothetical protein n=1 Tax=Yeosuana marina TaxID=1565536 RepID=UPI0030EEBF62|tara:strand:- start:3628 stop:4512 length:885 start_codon:yes stop_codon:yes gene_type:complete
MKIKIFTILTVLFVISNTFAQSNLNDYKYVIVPKKYEFLKEANQYRLNELTKFLFNKYGFETLMEGDNYPDELIKNRCLALKSDVIKDSGLFKTKLNVELKDCNDQIVYTTQTGESREKEYSKAYNEALRDAFKSFETINYNYVPKKNDAVAEAKDETNDTAEAAQEIQQLKEELQALKAKKETEVESEASKMEVPKTEVVQEKTIQTPVKTETPKVAQPETSVSDVLYAQAIDNGFQLVDSSPKVVYKIKKTSLENVFLVEGLNGTLLNKDGQWILEYYENGTLKQKSLNIKF